MKAFSTGSAWFNTGSAWFSTGSTWFSTGSVAPVAPCSPSDESSEEKGKKKDMWFTSKSHRVMACHYSNDIDISTSNARLK